MAGCVSGPNLGKGPQTSQTGPWLAPSACPDPRRCSKTWSRSGCENRMLTRSWWGGPWGAHFLPPTPLPKQNVSEEREDVEAHSGRVNWLEPQCLPYFAFPAQNPPKDTPPPKQTWGLLHGVGPRGPDLGQEHRHGNPTLAKERPSRAYSGPCLPGPLGFKGRLSFLLGLRPGTGSPHGYQVPTLSQPGQSSHPMVPTGLSRQTQNPGPAPPSVLWLPLRSQIPHLKMRIATGHRVVPGFGWNLSPEHPVQGTHLQNGSSEPQGVGTKTPLHSFGGKVARRASCATSASSWVPLPSAHEGLEPEPYSSKDQVKGKGPHASGTCPPRDGCCGCGWFAGVSTPRGERACGMNAPGPSSLRLQQGMSPKD